jgi:hypothetical protein
MFVQGSGVNVNNLREPDWQRRVTTQDLIHNHILLRKGKKNYVSVTAK